MSDHRQARVVAVIPAYNEEKTVGSVIRAVKGLYPWMDVVVVNDASFDNTAQVARACGAQVISHPVNLGDGAARQTGFIFAKSGGYDYVVQLDGDGQHDPASIEDLLAPVVKGEADLVIGSRFLGAKATYRIGVFRLAGMKFYSFLCSVLLGQRITDPTSGFRALNRAAIDLFSSELYPQKYPDANVILLSHYWGLRIREVPAKMNKSLTGKSIHSGLRPLGYLYTMTLSVFMMLLRRKSLKRGVVR